MWTVAIHVLSSFYKSHLFCTKLQAVSHLYCNSAAWPLARDLLLSVSTLLYAKQQFNCLFPYGVGKVWLDENALLVNPMTASLKCRTAFLSGSNAQQEPDFGYSSMYFLSETKKRWVYFWPCEVAFHSMQWNKEADERETCFLEGTKRVLCLARWFSLSLQRHSLVLELTLTCGTDSPHALLTNGLVVRSKSNTLLDPSDNEHLCYTGCWSVSVSLTNR